MRLKPVIPAAAALALAASAGPGAVTGAMAAPSYTFALVPKAAGDPTFDLARQGCMDEAKRLGGVTCLYKGPSEPEPAAQVRIVQDLVSQGVDGIALSAADADAAVPAIRQAREAGIPVVTFDADAPASARQATIGSDNHALGLALGHLLASLRPGGGTYALVSGSPAAVNLAERADGVREALKGTGWSEIASGSPTDCNDDPQLAVQQMGELKTANPDLGAIVVLGGWPLFAPDAYKGFAGPYRADMAAGRFAVVAADALEPELRLVRDGSVAGLVGQRPREMGARAMDVLLALKQGKPVDQRTVLGLDLVTRDTVGRFLK